MRVKAMRIRPAGMAMQFDAIAAADRGEPAGLPFELRPDSLATGVLIDARGS